MAPEPDGEWALAAQAIAEEDSAEAAARDSAMDSDEVLAQATAE